MRPGMVGLGVWEMKMNSASGKVCTCEDLIKSRGQLTLISRGSSDCAGLMVRNYIIIDHDQSNDRTIYQISHAKPGMLTHVIQFKVALLA